MNEVSSIYLKEEFKYWLVDSLNMKPEAANSYASYVASVDKHVKFKNGSLSQLIEFLHNQINIIGINNVIEDALEYLSREDTAMIIGKAEKTLSNWKSGLTRYHEFLYELAPTDYSTPNSNTLNTGIQLTEEIDTSIQRINALEVEEVTYSFKDLKDNFSFRLITQDRFYGDIYFPISLVKRLLYAVNESKFFRQWIENQISQIAIYLDAEVSTLGQISDLHFSISQNNVEVSAHCNSIKRVVFTPSANGNTQIPLKSKKLRNIAIDHIYPMKNILLDNIENLPALLQITAIIKQQVGSSAVPSQCKQACSELLKSGKFQSIDIVQLKKELNLIKSLTKLQIMDGSENSRKGARFN